MREGMSFDESGEAKDRKGALSPLIGLIHNPVAAWLFLACSLFLTAAAWKISSSSIAAKASTRFEFQTTDVTDLIKRRMLEYESVLRGGVSLFAAVPNVSRVEWHRYVTSLDLDEVYPGIQGIGFSQVIKPESLSDHVAVVRAEGFPNYRVYPEGNRDVYTSIVYLEPFVDRNLRAFGFDMFSEPTRRAAMELARDTGHAALSRMVTLVQETESDVQHGMLMYLPVYRQGVPIETIEDRRAALVGYVYSVFRIKDLMRGILESNLRDVGFQIFDGETVAQSTLLYDSENKNAVLLTDKSYRPDFSSTNPISIAGHTWTIYLFAKPGYLSAYQANQPLMVASAGVMIDVLLFVIIASLSRQRKRAEAAAQMVSRNKQKLNEARRIAQLGYIEYDPATRLWSLGAGTQEMLGIDPSVTTASTAEVFAAIDADNGKRVREFLSPSGPCVLNFELAAGNRFLTVRGDSSGEFSNRSTRLITLQDVTQRREAELERAEMIERMSESNRLESLGTLAGGVAHEINTPIQYIGDNLTFIKKWVPPLLDVVKHALAAVETGDWTEVGRKVTTIRYGMLSQELPDATEQSLGGIARITAIVQAIKEFSFPSEKTPHRFDLNKTVEMTVTVTRSQWKHVAVVNRDLAPDLPQLFAIEGEISQILVNLIVNAAHAIAEAAYQELGRIDVRTRVSGPDIEISVTDSGVGIPPENVSRLFEMFFTTKAPGKGTGQGLAIARSIVNRHGGTITVKSPPGAGACFTVLLPIVPTARESAVELVQQGSHF